ncbi:hypothetical protein MB84_27745 (plasmid) [Pandoraea oxalativorans]|uniref:Uncharacterized protein n=1 Tax=Pandoraea oxalativorans TaxID=573737 RepID=A0A0G3IHJ3_9BURK|nr:hypothetical protein MB84_27745 [Pandoraea oxalativorans]
MIVPVSVVPVRGARVIGAVAMRVRMRVATGMPVAVPALAAATLAVGPLNRMEGRHDIGDRRAQPFEHGLDDVVAEYQNSLSLDRRGQVTIADVPGQLDKMQRISRGDAVERLVERPDSDARIVVEQQLVTAGEHDRRGLIEEDFSAIGEPQDTSAQVALIMCHE